MLLYITMILALRIGTIVVAFSYLDIESYSIYDLGPNHMYQVSQENVNMSANCHYIGDNHDSPHHPKMVEAF